MQIQQREIDQHNESQNQAHKRKYDFLVDSVSQAGNIIQRLIEFQVAIPSWAVISLIQRCLILKKYVPSVWWIARKLNI